MPQSSSTIGRGVLRVTHGASDTGPVTVISVSDELDLARVPELQRALATADPNNGPVVLDLRELDFMDCAGAHLLVDSDRRLRQAGRSLLLVVVDRGPIDKLLALLGMAHQLLLIKQPRQARPRQRGGPDGARGLQPAHSGR